MELCPTLVVNSSEASLRLNPATSAAKMYRLFAIKWVRSHPRKQLLLREFGQKCMVALLIQSRFFSDLRNAASNLFFAQ